jgi:alginate O-acetyltransferase complex protein AlgI
MLFTITFGWCTGLMLGRWGQDRRKARAILILDIVVNIGLLGFFKYGGFVAANLNQWAGLGLKTLDLPLPLGISFYTFQTMSYTFDVYRGDAPVQPTFLSFGAYVALFPQLIAGPIVRYNTIAEQLGHRRESLAQFGQGAGIFAIGLAKKVLLANNIGVFWEDIRSLPPGDMTVLAAWAGIVAFGLQLYFDFSGYSDMAVGLGRMLGFSFERNFLYPYISGSVTEFWRRWHMSLGTWFREYLYIPLGGSRRGAWRTVWNLFVVWAATGLWHGANWNFVYWGLYYFAFLAGERYIWGGFVGKLPKAMRHLYTLAVVMVGWALFVFEDMPSLGAFLQALGGRADGGLVNDRIRYFLSSHAFVLAAAAIGATPLASVAFGKLEAKKPALCAGLKPVLLLAGLLLSTMYLVDSSYNPFLYFRF